MLRIVRVQGARLLPLLFVLLASMTLADRAGAVTIGTTWNLASNWADNSNPNSQWEYGSFGTNGNINTGTFSLSTTWSNPSYSQTCGAISNYTGSGQEWKNNGTCNGFNIDPGQVSLNADYGGTSTARWIAPVSGTYSLSAGFTTSGDDECKGVLVNRVTTEYTCGVGASWNNTLTLAAGSTIDLTVWGNTTGNGNTEAMENIVLTGLAYNQAAPSLSSSSLAFGNVRRNASPAAQSFTITNGAASGYSQSLSVSQTSSAANFSSSVSVSNLAAQSTSGSQSVSFNTSAAGHYSQSIGLQYTSNNQGSTDTLATATVSGPNVAVSGSVYDYATAHAAVTGLGTGQTSSVYNVTKGSSTATHWLINLGTLGAANGVQNFSLTLSDLLTAGGYADYTDSLTWSGSTSANPFNATGLSGGTLLAGGALFAGGNQTGGSGVISFSFNPSQYTGTVTEAIYLNFSSTPITTGLDSPSLGTIELDLTATDVPEPAGLALVSAAGLTLLRRRQAA